MRRYFAHLLVLSVLAFGTTIYAQTTGGSTGNSTTDNSDKKEDRKDLRKDRKGH